MAIRVVIELVFDLPEFIVDSGFRADSQQNELGAITQGRNTFRGE